MFRHISVIVACSSLSLCCSTRIDMKKFESVHRAGRSIEAGTRVGINQVKFEELVQNLAGEIAIARDKLESEEEKEILEIYSATLFIYQDSLALWRAKTKYATAIERLGGTGRILIGSEVSSIVAKYQLQTEPLNPAFPTGFQAVSEDSIQLLWGAARKELEKANALLYGK